MKIGDYVRTYHLGGSIEKIIEIVPKEKTDDLIERYITDISAKYMQSITTEQIIKSSPNIIDLIEVGDIITFKDDEDVYKVIGIPNKECALEVFYLAKKYDGNTEDIMIYPDEMKKYIKSVLTKEQFESMEYKI